LSSKITATVYACEH